MYIMRKAFSMRRSDLKAWILIPSGASVYAGTETKDDVEHNSQNILSYREMNEPGSST